MEPVTPTPTPTDTPVPPTDTPTPTNTPVPTNTPMATPTTTPTATGTNTPTPTAIPDTDSDGVLDPDDACPTTPGLAQRQGCPIGDENVVDLHVVDQAKTGACPDGKGSCKSPIEGAEVRVFDRNDSDFQAQYGTKNPSGNVYDQVFENDIGRVGACTTDAAGECTAGEETIGDYLVIVKYLDAETGKTVYTGKPKSPGDFVDTDADTQGDLATKDFQVIKVLRKNGSIQFSGGSKTVVTGSYLEIISPDFAIWENVAAGYVYPFIFISDSDWDVDLCARVPQGYAIVGVYDENGDLMSDARCMQTFVSGETKVIAYEVVDVGSPEPRLNTHITVSHRGRVTTLCLEVPGVRAGIDPAPGRPLVSTPNGCSSRAETGNAGVHALQMEAPSSSGPNLGLLTGIATTAGAMALVGAAWYARRRWLS